MVDVAHAAGAAAGGAAGGLTSFIPLILIFVVFYFLLIRPQQKQAKQHQAFLADLKKGQKILTKGGVFGTITGITDNVLTLEIAKDISIKISRDAVASAVDKNGAPLVAAKNAKKAEKKTK